MEVTPSIGGPNQRGDNWGLVGKQTMSAAHGETVHLPVTSNLLVESSRVGPGLGRSACLVGR